MTEGQDYSIGRHYIIEERHRNTTEGWDYSIGRHYTIEERHRNTIEGRNYSIGRYCSVRDWCRNVLVYKRMRGDSPKSFDYGRILRLGERQFLTHFNGFFVKLAHYLKCD